MSVHLNVEMLTIIKTKDTKLNMKLSKYNSSAYLFHLISSNFITLAAEGPYAPHNLHTLRYGPEYNDINCMEYSYMSVYALQCGACANNQSWRS